MEDRSSSAGRTEADTSIVRQQIHDTRIRHGDDDETLMPLPREPEPEPDDDDMGSTRVLSPDEEQILTAREQQQRAAIPIGAEGSVLGDFQIVKKLGEGAMGAVFLARQPTFENRLVALKVLFPHIASNEKLVNRLYREADAMFALDHPNIVASYGVDEVNGCHYIAMEYVDGDSLQKWINQRGRLSVGDAVHVALACARALEHAHAQGMIHRDVKPDNVLISRSGKVKITDLGMVKKLEEDEEKGLTMTGHAVGTPWYMPLEQAKDAKNATPLCDIYALGCMLYCMLTGHPPFAGHTIVEVIQAKEIGTFPRARSFNNEVPEKLDLIIAKMVQKLPRNRYQTCGEVIEALKGLGLANKKLLFLGGGGGDAATPKPGLATIVAPLATPTMAATIASASASQDTDSNKWFVRVRKDGQYAIKAMFKPELAKAVEEGKLDPSVKISRSPNDGFRALATYKEFIHVAHIRANRAAAKQRTTRQQSLYNQINKREREREQEKNVEYTTSQYWFQIFWRSAAIAVAVGALGYGFYWLCKSFVAVMF